MKSRTLPLLLFLIIISFLAQSCTFTRLTKYQPRSLNVGYSETQLAEDVYSVRYQGYGYMNPEISYDFCLLRCAELATMGGYKYFVTVQNKELLAGVMATTSPVVAGTTSPVVVATTPPVYPFNNVIIKLIHDKPVGTDIVYEASFIIRSVKTKYKID